MDNAEISDLANKRIHLRPVAFLAGSVFTVTFCKVMQSTGHTSTQAPQRMHSLPSRYSRL